jgi:hypothetical protein
MPVAGEPGEQVWAVFGDGHCFTAQHPLEGAPPAHPLHTEVIDDAECLLVGVSVRNVTGAAIGRGVR